MIHPACARDVSWVFGNMRAEDDHEIKCQHQEFDAAQYGVLIPQLPHSYVAYSDDEYDQPVMAFGAAPMNATTVSAWMVATDDARAVMPQAIRFFDGPLRSDLRRIGYRWAEVRSISTSTATHRMLKRRGFKQIADLPGFGLGGEDFFLFRLEL